MLIHKFIFCLKTLTLIFVVVCFNSSCVSNGTSQIQSSISDENSANTQKNAEIEQNKNFTNVGIEHNQNKSSKEKIKHPFQLKPRRKEINFSDDCQYTAGVGDEYFLENTCADALYDIQPELPKADCAYDLIKRDDLYSRLEGFSSIEFYSLSANKYLVEVLCRTGAYNLENVYLLYDESAIPAKEQVLEFPWIKPDDKVFEDFSDLKPPTDDYIAKNIELVNVKEIGGRYFDPKSKKLFVFNKGRGIGDFGQYARYSFVKDKPELEEFRAKYYYEKNSPEYQAGDIIKSPPKTWKRYYPK